MSDQSLADLLDSVASDHRERIAFRFEDRKWTYAELNRTTDAVAASLVKRGIRVGDRIAFLLPNSPELVFLNLACLKIGAISVPMNVRLKGEELAYIMNHCRARLAFVHVDLYPNLESVRSELPFVETIIVIGSSSAPSKCETYESFVDVRLSLSDRPKITKQAVAAILYTSGTTARPKGVTHTHHSLISAVRNYSASFETTSSDVVFGMLSMSHIFGYTLQLLAPLSIGATVIAAPSFDADRVLNVIGRDRVTHLLGLPVMFDTLSRKPVEPTADLKSLRLCLAGGDAVSQRLNASVYSTLGVELLEGCGMTEVIPYALNRPGIENRIGTIGKPAKGIELRLVDDKGNDVPTGEVGEILVRGESVTVGYWEDPNATAAVLKEGWFHTGDLARVDADGYFWFIGRSKEIIIRGGSNISPLEVEAVLIRHPSVREAAVVGIPHPVYKETVAAFVVLRPENTVSETELRQFAALKIADYKVPETITFIDELPRGLTGKIQRSALEDRVAKPVT